MDRSKWEYKKLGEVCAIERGGSPRPIADYITEDSNGINWIKIGDAIEGSRYITQTKEKIKPEGVKKSRLVHRGDFILSNSMSFGRPYILDVDGCIHDGWLVLHDNDNIFNKDFLYYYLSSPSTYNTFKKLAVGGVVNNLNSQLVRGVSVAIPPINDQQLIVAELDCLNEMIALKQEQLKEFDKLAQSIFYDMFINESKDSFEKIELKECVKEMHLGPFGSALKNEYFVPKENAYCMVYEQQHAIKKTMNLPTRYVNEEKFRELERFEVGPGDLLMSCRGTIGEVYVIPNNAPKGIIHPSLMKIRLNPSYIDRTYFLFLLTHIIKDKDSNGATIKMAITAKDLGKEHIPLPPLALQQQFAEKIQAIEEQKELVKKSIAETQQLLDYTMDKYFG